MSIVKCVCAHPVQDELYGKGYRVANPRGKDGKDKRCTVCGKDIVKEVKPVKKVTVSK